MKTRNIKTAGYSNATLHAKRDRKRHEAEDRNSRWRIYSPTVQLAILKDRGHGHCRQAIMALSLAS